MFNILLLLQVAFLPFVSAVLASALKSSHGQRPAVLFYGLSHEASAILFNVIWEYARRGRDCSRQAPTRQTRQRSAGFSPAPVCAVGSTLGAFNPSSTFGRRRIHTLYGLRINGKKVMRPHASS
ncbi:hypothetical protein [Micromonospora sp. B9E7]|uniref:hypothetical protein n=1 Tax=Micromonospora sp. B9E7 TaxID=3153574 RepID=UPI00325CAB6F